MDDEYCLACPDKDSAAAFEVVAEGVRERQQAYRLPQTLPPLLLRFPHDQYPLLRV